MTTREYKKHKGLKKESLRDNMTDVELMLNGLAEASATAISKNENPEGMLENAQKHISSEDELKLTEHSVSESGEESF